MLLLSSAARPRLRTAPERSPHSPALPGRAQAPLAEFTNRALQATGLASMLEGNDDGGWTLFAPTGDAWQRFLRFASPKKSEEDLLRDPSLPRLLLHHIAEGAFDPQARACRRRDVRACPDLSGRSAACGLA